MECPHCQREVPVGDECPLCGIVFERYQARHERPELTDTSGVEMAPIESRAPLTRTLLLVLALALAAFAYDRQRDDSATAVAIEPVVDPGQSRGQSPTRSAPPSETTPRVAARAAAPEPTPPPRVEPPLVAPPLAQPDPELPLSQPSTYTYDWYEGADGFARGWREAQDEGRAVAVYFYTDWCGYCRQLERELLDRAKVENYTKYLTKVKINPENGPTERAIANRYRVSGYPSFFVHPAVDRGPTKVSGMTRRHGEWRVKSPDEFVEALRRVVGD